MTPEARAKCYGYWTGVCDLQSIPMPDWSELSALKRAWKRWRYVPKYIYEESLTSPLTFHHPDGYMIRPAERFQTDMGSVPRKLQGLVPWLFSKDLWLRAYVCHDNAYGSGGLRFAQHDPEEFVFCKMTRATSDELLCLMIKASGGGRFSSAPIWAGVRLGGWTSWNSATDTDIIQGS